MPKGEARRDGCGCRAASLSRSAQARRSAGRAQLAPAEWRERHVRLGAAGRRVRRRPHDAREAHEARARVTRNALRFRRAEHALVRMASSRRGRKSVAPTSSHLAFSSASALGVWFSYGDGGSTHSASGAHSLGAMAAGGARGVSCVLPARAPLQGDASAESYRSRAQEGPVQSAPPGPTPSTTADAGSLAGGVLSTAP